MPNLPTDWRAARERKNIKWVRAGKARHQRGKSVPVTLSVLNNKASLNQIKSKRGVAAQ